uniref:ABC transporter n=1 Tax=Salvia miltiorrhiza TaxID=226208 RepID=A0A8E6YIF7_SALMI|nr:ABC transporter [Salvia miltiorrhiza]
MEEGSRNSSGRQNMWRNAAGSEIFSWSSRERDDEEALIWAALERLPTHARIRKGVYSEEKGGDAREVDVMNLGFAERKNLIDRLLDIAHQDNEVFLLKMKRRIDRVGINLPTVEVRFEKMSVDALTYVGTRALPTLPNFAANIFEGLLTKLHILPSRKKPLSVLHDLNGIIRAGRMTLLLGPPTSGKTTLLTALAGKLDQDLQLRGKITYNGHEMDEFIPQRTSAYIGQQDLHLGELTVRETLAYSARCQGVGTAYDMLAELLRREKEANIKPDPDLDIFMKAASIQGQEVSVMTDYIMKVINNSNLKSHFLRRSTAVFNGGNAGGFAAVNCRRRPIAVGNGVADEPFSDGELPPVTPPVTLFTGGRLLLPTAFRRRMTLLLGPPTSGKTTLLTALAGKLDQDLQLRGKITYNGHEMDEFIPQRTSAYIGQQDLHLGELTVRETLAYSARCQGVGTAYEMLAELLRREKEANIKPDPDLDIFMKAASIQGQEVSVMTDYIMKILGLEICADTIVGNELFRGISGGEKKRVTIGEMLVGPARALFMDEISTGLDSSTTFEIVNSVKQFVHILRGTAVISLLQPAPETFQLFDDIILLSDGRIVYQGPRHNVVEFFESLGFRCPHRKGVADFLQEVTSRKDQEQYWARRDESYRFVSVDEFSEAFWSFHVGREIGDHLSVPFDKAKSHPAALTTHKYGLTQIQVLKANISREFLIMKRNSPVYIFRMIQLLVMATISSTIFLRTEMEKQTVTDGGIYMGALFFTLIVVMFNGFSDMALSILRLPVFYKQRDLLFFPVWSYSLPAWILRIPISFLDVAIWALTTYYSIGFDSDATRFFKYWFVLVWANQMASAMFRLMGSLARNMTVANSFGTCSLVTVFVLAGFIVSRDKIKKWWIWGYWSSPMMYGQNAIAVNEFLGKSWNHISSSSGEALGVTILKSRGLFPQAYWYWIGVGALVGYVFLFNFLETMALTYLNPFGKPQPVLSQQALAERNAVKNTEPSDRPTASNEEANPSKKRGMVLPFQPHSITFQDIHYSVDMPQEMKGHGVAEDKLELLKGINGALRPGVLTALMGVTGAGKTTLMDVLSGRKTTGYISGTITISGHPKKQETFARIAGYCEQTDIHSPHLTIYDSLLYSACLRLPPEVDSATRKMFIEEVMELVELSEIRDGLVGLPGVNGLSPEQRKRLTVAVELVANPSIIFMDEPTSGLDARAAAIVMRAVRNTVDTGRTVVCTIHQPSIHIFDSFDELMLLKRGGEEIFVGPLGRHSSLLIQYFEGIDGVVRIKDGYNPATWMLEVTSMAQEAAFGVDFAQLYKSSELYRRNKALIAELSKAIPGSKDVHFGGRYSQSLLEQCKACLWKQQLSYSRNPPYIAVRLMFTTFIALMLGTIFWDLGSKRRNKALIAELSKAIPGSKDVHFGGRYSQSLLEQCKACLWKQQLSYSRNPPYIAVRLMFTTFIALMLGTIFWDLGSKRPVISSPPLLVSVPIQARGQRPEPKPLTPGWNRQAREKSLDIFNAMGSMYAAVLFLGVQNAASVQPVVAVERTVFYRERAAGMYSALPYAFGQVVVEVPHILSQTLIYGVIVYAMIGFEWSAVKFFWYIFFTYFTLLYFTLYGMMAVAVTPNHNIAAIVSSAFYGIWNIFSGFIIPKSRIPIWWRWYYYLCPIAWTLYGLVASQFGDIEDVLETNQTVEQFIREYYGFEHDFVGYVALIVAGIALLFGFIFAFSIRVFNFQTR